MPEIFYDLTTPRSGMNYRWVQPPQIAYFVTTVDNLGNVNATPVTLGTCVGADMSPDSCGNYFFTFALGSKDLPQLQTRHAHRNLQEVPECVISYIGADLIRESQVACCPLPKGISEIEVAGLTEIPSRKVRPPGIRECGINIEAKVVSSCPLGDFYHLYVCRAVGVSVDAQLVEADEQSPLHAGTLAIDPLYEVTILPAKDGPPRLYYIRLDRDSVQRMPDDIGPTRAWVGAFENWIEDETARGTLARGDAERIVELAKRWKADPNPETNRDTKDELTRRLKEMLRPKPQ